MSAGKRQHRRSARRMLVVESAVKWPEAPKKPVRYHVYDLDPPNPDAPMVCNHEWPTANGETDMEGCCAKCGKSFIAYIHMDCI